MLWIREVHDGCRATVYTGSGAVTKEITFSPKIGPEIQYLNEEWWPCDPRVVAQANSRHPPLKVRLNNGQPRNLGTALLDLVKNPNSRGRVPILPDHVLLLQSGEYHVYMRRRPGHRGSPRGLVKKTAKAFGKTCVCVCCAMLRP
jgi:hypothetical protein